MKNASILPYLTKPGRYLGHEVHAVRKDWDTIRLHSALVFPDLYEIGMSHQGLQILYHILNKRDDILAERCFCPDIDLEKLLGRHGLPLASLESDHPLKDFDVVGITLPYELCYSNILTILHLAGIPFQSADRDESFPLILGGGSCSMNPEPVADFFDAILLGDGEEAILEIADVLIETKEAGLNKADLLRGLAGVAGVYIPSFFRVRYNESGRITAVDAMEENHPTVRRRIVPDLNRLDHLKHPLVPNAKIVHDRLGIEIARGCTRGCRFCQAGITYRPVRERAPEQVLELARDGIADSGFEELALLSLSTGDYSCLEQLLPALMDAFAAGFVSVSMPSMRVGTLSQTIMDQIKRVRKTGFTVAPEAGSERLRRFINKGITEEALLATCRDAFSLGWNVMKLYFMIGLPTETLDDVEAIADLARKTMQEGDQHGRRRRQITVSVGTFVPKPHTPLQWERQLTVDESRQRLDLLKEILPRRGCKLKWHDPEQSFLEGVFSRGDRRLARLVQLAWQDGARLDGWSDHFNLSIWQQAATACDLDLNDYLRPREFSEILPWHHLHSGIDDDFLKKELDRAHALVYTPDCRYHECQKCGSCDFKTIKPVVCRRNREMPEAPPPTKPKTTRPPEDRHFKYLVSYERTGDICYLGHLEILQMIYRGLRRAGIKTNFSKGFNPTPKVSFAPALPVGMESLAEYFIIDLPAPLDDCEQAAVRLDRSLPDGVSITQIRHHSGGIPQDIVTTYSVVLPGGLSEEHRLLLAAFEAAAGFVVARERKGKRTEIDLRPLVASLSVEAEDTVAIKIISRTGVAGIKVQEAIGHILGLAPSDLPTLRLQKIGWSPLVKNGNDRGKEV